MTALERIEEIEAEHEKAKTRDTHVPIMYATWEREDILLRAFRVMREIAVEAIDTELTGSQSKAGLAAIGVNEDFEERMKQ